MNDGHTLPNLTSKDGVFSMVCSLALANIKMLQFSLMLSVPSSKRSRHHLYYLSLVSGRDTWWRRIQYIIGIQPGRPAEPYTSPAAGAWFVTLHA
jgi:hypothetical protein